LVRTLPSSPHFHPQGIEDHHRVDGIERPLLPGRHFLEHRVGDGADGVRSDVDVIQLLQVPLDLADCHPRRVERQYVLIELGKPPRMLRNQLRL
jgi:hypothetical protein